MKNRFVLIMIIGFTFSNCAVYSQTVRKNLQPKDEALLQPASDTLKRGRLAYDLAIYGYKAKSALALTQAAELVISFGGNFQTLEPSQTEQGKGASDDTKVKHLPLVEPSQLLKDARQFAKGNVNIIAIIEKLEGDLVKLQAKPITKGGLHGQLRLEGRVYGKNNNTYHLTMIGKELAEVALVGDGDTDIDLYMYDEYGNLIIADEDNSDRCYVSFTPAWTGTFKVVVKNRGNFTNDYVLITN